MSKFFSELSRVFLYANTSPIVWFLATLCFLHGIFLFFAIVLPFEMIAGLIPAFVQLLPFSVLLNVVGFLGFLSFSFDRPVVNFIFAFLNLIFWTFLLFLVFVFNPFAIVWTPYFCAVLGALWLTFRNTYDSQWKFGK